MANPKKDLYLAIKEQILCEVDIIKHVQLWNNQPNRESEEEAFAYPCAFVEFEQLIWTGQLNQVQTGDVNIKIHVCFERYNTDDTTFFCTIQDVYIALQGFAGGCSAGLQRIEEQQDIDHDNVSIWEIIFSTRLTDGQADPRINLQQTTITSAEVNIDLDIDNDIIRTGDGKL